jgi:hypothetical protein
MALEAEKETKLRRNRRRAVAAWAGVAAVILLPFAAVLATR